MIRLIAAVYVTAVCHCHSCNNSTAFQEALAYAHAEQSDVSLAISDEDVAVPGAAVLKSKAVPGAVKVKALRALSSSTTNFKVAHNLPIPRSLVRGGQTHPHMPRLVVSFSTWSIPPPPRPVHSFAH